MIANAEADLEGAGRSRRRHQGSGIERYPKAKVGDFDGNPQKITEMDALVAYLQMLGTLVDFSTYDDAAGYR
jgi:cytochrome c oxidase cbb3-type subunit 2